MNKDVKDYRNAELKSYVIGNILIILIASGLLDYMIIFTEETTSLGVISTVITSAIFSSVLYNYIFLVDALMPSNWKDKLIWCGSGMPGETIFTTIKEKNEDKRFTSKHAMDVYKEVYQKISETNEKERKAIENSEWYGIYKKNEDHVQISTSQRDFLLCRDMTAITIIIAIGYVLFQSCREQYFSWRLFLFFGIELVVSWGAAKIKGKRFAYNVIAVDISKTKK